MTTAVVDRFTVAVPPEMRDQATERAASLGWSRSQYVRYLISRDLGVEPHVPFSGKLKPRDDR